MFQIKICGLTTPEDALAAIEAGADALGLNFHPASPRYVTPPQAAQIVQKVRHAGWGGTVVAVVVQDETTLAADPQLACIDAWQLHGDQPPENLATFQKMLAHTQASPSPANSSDAGRPRWRTIRALAWRRDEPSFLFDYLQACQRMGVLPDALLVDAFQSGLFGGTGRTLDWDALAAQRDALGGLPLILAGGLTPENVAMAIQRVRPAAVDVASGVESSPGRKDPAKLRAFVAAARGALQATQGAKRL